MGITKTYKVIRRELAGQTSSVVSKRLRMMMRCYGIRDFEFGPMGTGTFTFKMTHQREGIILPKNDKLLKGRFEIHDFDPTKKYTMLQVFFEGDA